MQAVNKVNKPSRATIRPGRVRGKSFVDPNDIPDELLAGKKRAASRRRAGVVRKKSFIDPDAIPADLVEKPKVEPSSDVIMSSDPKQTPSVHAHRPGRIRGLSCRHLIPDESNSDNNTQNTQEKKISVRVKRVTPRRRPSRVRGRSFIIPAEIPNDLLESGCEPTTLPNNAPSKIANTVVPVKRPDRIRGNSIRNLTADGGTSDSDSSSGAETLPNDDNLFTPGKLCTLGFQDKPLRRREDSFTPGKVCTLGFRDNTQKRHDPFVPGKLCTLGFQDKTQTRQENTFVPGKLSTFGFQDKTPKRDDKPFIPGKLCTLGFQEKPKVMYKIRASCPDGKVKVIKGSLEALQKHVRRQKRLGKPITEAPSPSPTNSIRVERQRGISFRALSDVAIKGDETDDSSYDASCSENESIDSCTERTDGDFGNDDTARMDDEDEEFIPGKLCTLGFQDTSPKPILKIQANCPSGQVQAVRENIDGNGQHNVSPIRRIGRQASIQPAQSVKDKIKTFQS